MRVLVDTHLMLWAVASSRRLPPGARSLTLDAANEVFYSAASVWEGLPGIHRDPFDRLLVAQSLAEPMTLLTNDAVLAGYGPFVQLV